MSKPVCALLILCLLASCSQPCPTEGKDVPFWNSRFVSAAFQLLYSNEDSTQALRYFDSAMRHSSATPTVYPRAARFELIANYHYFFTRDVAACSRMIDSTLALYSSEDLQNSYPKTYVGYLLFGGQTAYRLSQYNKANDYYFRAKKLADRYLNTCERKSFNYSIGMVLYRQQNFRASMNYFKEAFAQQQTCVPATRAVALQQQEIQSNIGLCHLQLKTYDSALLHFDTALQIANQFKDSLGPKTMDVIYGVIYGHRAQVLMAKGQLQEAERLSLKSIALNDRPGHDTTHALSIKLQLTDVYSRQQNFSAMQAMLNTVGPQVAVGSRESRMEWKRLMADYYEQTGQPANALPFVKMYAALKDSIEIDQKELNAADIARQLHEKEREVQITRLKKDKQMALVSLWVTVVVSCMALAIIYLIYQTYRRNKKNLAVSLALNQEIQRQKAAREAEAAQRHRLITEAVIKAQESERSIIGLELHDNINQVLTTVKLHNEMVLEGFGDPKVLLPRALGYLQDCIHEIRSLSKRLSAPTLGKISLEESVKDLIDSINMTSKVKISRQITGFDNQLLQRDLHLGVYRILQEQLNNVLKHAEASEVFVGLERRDGRIRLLVKDNGKGFVLHNSKNGIGLMNMQTRAENLNGTFAMETQPGDGCRVEVVIPYPS